MTLNFAKLLSRSLFRAFFLSIFICTCVTAYAEEGTKRALLIGEIWGDGVTGLPGHLPDQVYQITIDPRLSNGQVAEELIAPIADGLNSRMRFFSPFVSNGRLMIHH